MALFSHNTNTNVLIAIEYATTLINSGYSRENILANLGKKSFGEISAFSNSAIRKMNKGKSYHDAIKELYDKQQQQNVKRFISAFNAEDSTNIVPILTDLSNHILKEKELTVDNLIDNLSSKMQKMMMVMALPLAIFFLLVIEDALPSINGIVPRPTFDYFIYGITIIILLWLIIKMKYNE